MRKKRNSAVVMVLSFALTGTVLAGCGENKQSGQDISTSISQESEQDFSAEKTETETKEKAEAEAIEEAIEETEPETVEESGPEQGENVVQEPEEYEDNFAVDSMAAKEFAGKVKDATAKKDLEALAELTAFPVYVGLPDVNVVETKEDFLKLGAETIFTDELLQSVEMADIENFQPSMAGFSISNGGTANINFGVVDGVLAINGINY